MRKSRAGTPIIGLTGGIASGKTTVMKELRRCGAHVVEADRISREIMNPGTGPWKKTIEKFGTVIQNADGTINRRKLGEIVFSNAAKRRALERITHPAIIAGVREKTEKLSRRAGVKLVVIDAPLLYEAGLDKEVDRTVVVWAPYEMQLERLCRRDRLDAAAAAKRIDSQWPLEKKKKLADYVVDNSAAAGGMKRQVKSLWGVLTKIRK